MSMEMMEKRVYPCEDVAKKELSRTITYASNGLSRYTEKFRDMTCPVSGAEIPWDTADHLGILGSGNPSCNDALEAVGIKPGVYTNYRGTWLILIRPAEAGIQRAVDRCGGRLLSLEAHNISIPELDVSVCPLLKELRVWYNGRLLRISGLERLERLTRLDLTGCNNLRALPGLERLERLMNLNLTSCSSLRALPGLEQLGRLTNLTIVGCRWLEDLSGLERLGRLTKLTLFGCSGLRELPDLSRLEHLTHLSLSECSGLRELPEGISKLKSLRWLDLRNMKLKTLPDWLPEIAECFEINFPWVNPSKQERRVCLTGTTVEDMQDLSIFEQPYEMVAAWFKDRNKVPLNEIKVVFLGDGEAGKSHTIARLMNDGGDPVDYMDQSTPGIVIKHKDYSRDDRNFRVHYWDFGGQEIMHSMHRIFLTNRTMYVVLLNARDDTQGDRAHYWLQNIQSFAPDAPVLLVLNKIDQNPKASVDETTLRARYPGLRSVVRLSARDFDRELFNREFTQVLLNEIDGSGYLNARWPQSWIAVKEQLENMKTHYILGSAYRELCRDCQVEGVQTELLHWFNDLGVSFCFCDEEDYTLNKHVILRPDWITNALYIILFNECTGTKNGQIPRKGIYALLERSHEDKAIKCTLPDARYDTPGDIAYVLGVMRKFQLSLDAGDDMEFIPMLCQQDSTVDIHYYEKDTETLEFCMEFEYLPDNLLHRLMVERHGELDMDNVWRKGAKFRMTELGLSAVVVIDGGSLRFFIQHRDAMHRPNTYLTMLKANVDRIVRKMGIKAPVCKLIYKIHGKRAEFSYDRLLKMHARGRKEEYCEALDEDFQIEDILNQSAPEGLEDEQKLLAAIRKACLNIQGDMHYRGSEEDVRNTRIRDELRNIGYVVHDQTRQGITASGKRPGELDLDIRRENNEPWTIVESLRCGSKSNWNEHLEKLLDRYNAHGLRSLFLIAFVDCEKSSFRRIWKRYRDDHIQGHDAGRFTYVKDSFRELPEASAQLIKIASSQYDCGGSRYTVYHIFLQMEPK